MKNKLLSHLSPPTRIALLVMALYFGVAISWILLSDWALDLLVDTDRISYMQTLKGWLFVSVTSVLLFWLVHNRASAIERRRSNLASALQASPLPIYITQQNGTVVFWNVAAERGLGWTAQEVVGKPDPLKCTNGDEEADARRQALIEGKRLVGVELRRANRNGDWRYYDVFASRLESGPNGDGDFVFILDDITDRRRRQKITEQRQQAHRMQTDFDQAVGVIGHELRTPLAALQANAEVLLSDGLGDADTSRQLLQIIHDEVRRMTAMANNMLESARLQSGQAIWNWHTVPISDICSEAVEVLRPLIDARRVNLSYEVLPAGLAMMSDPDALRRLLINLVTNAAKHTPEGDIHIEIKSLDIDGQRWIELTVRDTGFGMTAETLDKLGRAFATNQGAVGEGVVHGAGLGLAICCHIVAAHNGRIAVASKPRAGTRIICRLAADLAEPATDTSRQSIICEVES